MEGLSVKGVTTILNVILKDESNIYSPMPMNLLHENRFKLSEKQHEIKNYENIARKRYCSH